MHSHCGLLDLVYFLLYKIYREAKNAKQSTVFRWERELPRGPSPQILANGTSRYMKEWQHGRGAVDEMGPGSYDSCLLGVFRGISG